MDYVEFHREPPSNLTTMVVGFGGWIDAGEAATGTVRHLVKHLSASRLASIDPEEFFVFTQERPDVRLREDGERAIRWPRSEFYTWQPSDDRSGLLLFYGMEPNQRWRTYTKTLLDVAEQCGVKRIVSLGALLAGLPHTRAPRVTGRTTDSEWQVLLEDWGIFRRPTYEGPTGIATVVLEAAAERRMSSLAFMGQAPHYLQGASNPAVIQAILTYVNRLLDLGLDVSELDEAVTVFGAECDQAVSRDSSTQAHVRQLEQEYDSPEDEDEDDFDGDDGGDDGALYDEDLNSDQLMQELEDFLREERGGGSGS